MHGGHGWLQILLLLDDIYWLMWGIWQVFILPEFKSWSLQILLQHSCHFLMCRNSHELTMKARGKLHGFSPHSSAPTSSPRLLVTWSSRHALLQGEIIWGTNDDLTGSRNSWGDGLTCLSTKSDTRKPGPSPGSSLAWDEEPKEGDLWLWPAKLSSNSSIWRTTRCELLPMQLICQAKGIWKATEWITGPQLATHCLAQAVMCQSQAGTDPTLHSLQPEFLQPPKLSTAFQYLPCYQERVWTQTLLTTRFCPQGLWGLSSLQLEGFFQVFPCINADPETSPFLFILSEVHHCEVLLSQGQTAARNCRSHRSSRSFLAPASLTWALSQHPCCWHPGAHRSQSAAQSLSYGFQSRVRLWWLLWDYCYRAVLVIMTQLFTDIYENWPKLLS